MKYVTCSPACDTERRARRASLAVLHDPDVNVGDLGVLHVTGGGAIRGMLFCVRIGRGTSRYAGGGYWTTGSRRIPNCQRVFRCAVQSHLSTDCCRIR
jgi:hypothetical protein